jgi:hypothetical protein
MSPAPRHTRIGRVPGVRATALALAGLVAGGGQMTEAATPEAAAPALTPAEQAAAAKAEKKAKAEAAAKAMAEAKEVAAKAAAAAQALASEPIAVVEGGRAARQMLPEAARKDGLTVVDLSDDWLPYVFSETPEKPQTLRPFLLDLANGRLGKGKQYARPREDRFFEVFGIFPSPNMVRRRLADKKRHACHDKVKDDVLGELSPRNVIPPEELEKVPNPNPETRAETPMVTTGRTISPRPLTEQEKRAVIAMQAHLRCEDMLRGRATPGRMDRWTAEGLKVYQHLHQLADNAKIDPDTRAVLMGDSREHDFRLLLRVLRERVVDATGLLEDGSAVGVQGQVQGRVLDSPEFQPLAVPAEKLEAAAGAPGPAAGAPGSAGGPAAPDASAKIRPAPDLIAPATHAAAEALGWKSPEAALANNLPPPAPPPGSKKPRKAATGKGPAPLPWAVAIKLPPLPPYHGSKMELRAEVDRGEVQLERPKLDKDGKKKWKPPVADRPTLTLYAKAGDHEVALCRWPTTIGGWKMFEKKDGTMALKYKGEVTGDALWPEVLATPTWHPAPGMPIKRLVVKRGDTFEGKAEIVGPGYRAAYGLVAITHHQIMERNEKGEPQLMDLLIRTHGTPGYRAVKRGESNGCHRLHNFEALRLAAFLVKHHEHVREGLVREDYVRKMNYKGQEVALESDFKGYRFKLTPPIPVTVLEGDVKGDPKAVKRMVPVAAVP